MKKHLKGPGQKVHTYMLSGQYKRRALILRHHYFYYTTI